MARAPAPSSYLPPPVHGSSERMSLDAICRRSGGWSRAASSHATIPAAAASSASSNPSRFPADSYARRVAASASGRIRANKSGASTAAIASIAATLDVGRPTRRPEPLVPDATNDAANDTTAGSALAAATSSSRRVGRRFEPSRARTFEGSRSKSPLEVIEVGGGTGLGRRVRAHTDAHASANAHAAPPGATASIASPGGLRRAHLAFPSVDPRRSPRPPPPSGEISGTRRAREPDPGTVAGWSSWSNAGASASSSARQSRSIVAAIDVDVEETPASAFALDARRGACASLAVVVPALGDPGFAARVGFPAAAAATALAAARNPRNTRPPALTPAPVPSPGSTERPIRSIERE